MKFIIPISTFEIVWNIPLSMLPTNVTIPLNTPTIPCHIFDSTFIMVSNIEVNTLCMVFQIAITIGLIVFQIPFHTSVTLFQIAENTDRKSVV